jgi:fructose-specific phosphotransferase system IIC component
MNTDPVVRDGCHHFKHFKCLSWSAVFAGAFVGIGLTFLLNLFCVSIGLSIVTTNQEGITSLAIGGFIALLISVFVAMFFAGMTAGCLARPYCYKKKSGILYGFLAWSVALLLTVMLASHMTRFVTSYSDFVYHRDAAVVSVVNNNTSPAVSATGNTNTADVTVNAQKAVNQLGYSAFVIFILFFAGAFAASLGGHCGMVCKCKEDEEDVVVVRKETTIR